MAAHQAPLSLGFSRQEHWSGLPFPSPMHESENEVAQSCPTLSNPMDCSPPGYFVHGIFQARVLEFLRPSELLQTVQTSQSHPGGGISLPSYCLELVHLFQDSVQPQSLSQG